MKYRHILKDGPKLDGHWSLMAHLWASLLSHRAGGGIFYLSLPDRGPELGIRTPFRFFSFPESSCTALRGH